MASRFGFRLTEKAQADLDGIISYIAVELSNPEAASEFMDQLQKTIREAQDFPDSGSQVNNEYLPNGNVRRKLVGNYILYYLPEDAEKEIIVLRVIYSRRSIEEIQKYLYR